MTPEPTGEGKPQNNRRSFVSNFCIAVHVRGEFSAESLRRALDGIRPRHAVLIPEAAGGEPERAHFSLQVIEKCGEQDWVEAVKEQLRIPFPEGGPFARFILLRRGERSDLVGAFNHGACDGFSGVYVMRDILRLLGEPDNTLPPLPAPPRVAAMLPASVAENPRLQRRVNRTIRGLRFTRSVRRLRARLFPRPAPPAAAQAEPAESGLPASQRFCILTHTLTAAQTDALVERSRAEGTTVHTAICAAWLRAYAAQLGDPGPRRRWISSPVNLRGRMARPVDETAGMFLSTVESPIDCSPRKTFWQVARRFKEDLRRASTDEKVFIMPLLFNTLFSSVPPEEIGELAAAIFGRPVRYDFSITNMGRLDIPPRVGSLEVEGFHNLVNSSEHERTVGINTFGGRLTFIFILRESNMDPAGARRLMESAIQQLAEASGWAEKKSRSKP